MYIEWNQYKTRKNLMFLEIKDRDVRFGHEPWVDIIAHIKLDEFRGNP